MHSDLEPNLAWYSELELEDLFLEPEDENSLAQVDWEYFLRFTVEAINSQIVADWEGKCHQHWDQPAILTSRQNGEYLTLIREIIGRLNFYSDVRAYAAWLSGALEELEKLQAEIRQPLRVLLGKKRLAARALEMADLELEIAEFENDFGFRDKVKVLEEAALLHYSSQIVAAQARAQSRRELPRGVGDFGNQPEPSSINSSYDFEHYCCEWMHYLGDSVAQVSQATGDGGADIISETYVAQVKYYNGPIPVSQVRDLLGTSVDFRKKPIFFASMSYSKGSIEFANRNMIPLFLVDAHEGEIRAGNNIAQRLLHSGLQP
jgi:hypothetical protein